MYSRQLCLLRMKILVKTYGILVFIYCCIFLIKFCFVQSPCGLARSGSTFRGTRDVSSGTTIPEAYPAIPSRLFYSISSRLNRSACHIESSTGTVDNRETNPPPSTSFSLRQPNSRVWLPSGTFDSEFLNLAHKGVSENSEACVRVTRLQLNPFSLTDLVVLMTSHRH